MAAETRTLADYNAETVKRSLDLLRENVVTRHTKDTIVFRQHGRWNCYMKFVLVNRGTLVVVGDLGEAIYQWSDDVSLDWISRLDIGYFISKCQASEVGRRFYSWDPGVARHRLAELIRDMTPEVKSWYRGGSDAIECATEWSAWLAHAWHDGVLDSDWCSSLIGVGEVPHIRAVCHIEGLRLAISRSPGEEPSEGGA